MTQEETADLVRLARRAAAHGLQMHFYPGRGSKATIAFISTARCTIKTTKDIRDAWIWLDGYQAGTEALKHSDPYAKVSA